MALSKDDLRHRSFDVFNLYVAEGWSLQKIGDKYGITRERVRQIIAHDWADRPVAELRAMVKESERRVSDRAAAKVCPCCLKEHNRGSRTCSKKCSTLWNTTRYRRDGAYRKKHKFYKARSVLKHQDKYPPEQVRHAEAVQNGTARTYDPPRFSRTSQAEMAMLNIEGLRGVID